jgi:DNA mismatch repair protein MutS2
VQVEVKSEAVLLPQTGANTADLRGMRADEALEKLDLFLDAAFAAHIDAVYVIHGHGTGALKRAVRGWLPSSPYIASFRRGEHGEGGDGVTIAFLRR